MTKHTKIIDFDETLENMAALVFFNMLTEGKLEDAKASLSGIPQSQTAFDAFSKSPQIQKYIDSGLFKPAFWQTVANWFKNNRFLDANDVVNAISEMFDNKMNDIIKSFTTITTFNDFANRIHAYGEESKRDIASSDYFKNAQTKNYKRTNTVPNGGIIPSPDDIVYNDSNIMIIRADDVTKAQRYGNGYGWCVSALGSNNLFFNYTLSNDGGEFFYILKKHADYTPVNSGESAVYRRIDFADRTHYSAVMYDGKTYSLTLANNGYVNGGNGPYDGNTMNDVAPEKIISLLSNGDQAVKTSLKAGLRAMQQAWKGMSPERQEFLSKLKNTELTDEEFNKLSGTDKYTYINLGHTLTDGQLDILRKSKAWGDAARVYLRATMVTGNIPYSQFTSITKLTNDDLAEAGSNPNFTAPNGIAASYIRELKDISAQMRESNTPRPSYIWIYENPQLWKDYVKSRNTKIQHETLQTQTEQLLEDIAFEIFIGKPIYHEQFKQMSLEYDPNDGMDFDCEKMRLTSLEGVPQSIGRSFSCDDNQLTSLKGAPQYVRESFSCNNNQLTSLKGAPQSVGYSFSCKNNYLTSLEGAPQYVPGYFSCDDNQLTTLAGAPQYVGLRFSCKNNPKLSEAQISHYEEFLTGMHRECLVDWHYMPPDRLK